MNQSKFSWSPVKKSKHGNTIKGYRTVAPSTAFYYERKSMSVSMLEYNELLSLDRHRTNIVISFTNPSTGLIDDKPYFAGNLGVFLSKELTKNYKEGYVVFLLTKPA